MHTEPGALGGAVPPTIFRNFDECKAFWLFQSEDKIMTGLFSA